MNLPKNVFCNCASGTGQCHYYTYWKQSPPPNAKPKDFWPDATYSATSERVHADLNVATPVCSLVGPRCLMPEYGAGEGIVGFTGGDLRLPEPQQSEAPGWHLMVPGTEPVAANGAFTLTVSDLTFPGFIPYSFTRYYRSDVSFQSPLGYGWNHNYGQRIVPGAARFDDPTICTQGPADVFYVSPTMDRIRFSYASSDAAGAHYVAPLQPALRLAKAPGQHGAWTFQIGGELLFYVFEPEHGDLVAVRDNTGHAITLTWKHPPAINGDIFEDSSGYLDTVTDTRGLQVYYRYAEPGKEPITPPFPGYHGKKFRPLKCITLSNAQNACDVAPLVTFQMDAGSPRAADLSPPEFNLIHVADAKGSGPTYTYDGATLLDYSERDRPYLPDAEIEPTCNALCRSKDQDCRNIDLCRAESTRPCRMAEPTAILSKPDRHASACFKYCIATTWDGTEDQFSEAYQFCNVIAGCPKDEKHCPDYSRAHWDQCRTLVYDPTRKVAVPGSCGDTLVDNVLVPRDDVDHCAQFQAQCVQEAQAATAAALPQCRTECKASCLAQRAATDGHPLQLPDLFGGAAGLPVWVPGARRYAYGVPLSLNHNLLKLMDADQRVVIENTYGTDPFSPDFDRVIKHVQGAGSDNVMEFEYHDFVAEQSPYAVKPPPYASLLAGFKSIQVCPPAQSGDGFDRSKSIALPNGIQQPAYGVKVTDIAGVTRINYYDARWNPLREVNITAGTTIDYNHKNGFLVGVQDPTGERTCIERDDQGRPLTITRLPSPTKFNGIPWESALPEMIRYAYDDAGQLVEVIRDPDGPAPTGTELLRDSFERIIAVGQSVGPQKALWTCLDYSETSKPSRVLPGVLQEGPTPSARYVPPGVWGPTPGARYVPPSVLQEELTPGARAALPHGVFFLRSGCARSLVEQPFRAGFVVDVEPYTIRKPDGSVRTQSGLTPTGPSEVAIDALGEDPVTTYTQRDPQDPFGLTVEAGRGGLASKKVGSASRVVGDKSTGLVMAVGQQDPKDGTWVDMAYDYGLSRQIKTITSEALQRKLDTDVLGHVTSIQEIPINDPFGTPARTTCFNHDISGRLLDRMLPEGNVEHYAYNALGLLVSVKRGSVSKKPVWASACTLPKGSVDTMEEVAHYNYDKSGVLVAADQEGLHTDFVRDGMGRIIDEVVKHHTFTSPKGNVLTVAQHHVVRYDSLGRVAWEGIFDNPPYEYKKPSNLTTSMYAMTEYQYDGLGRVIVQDKWSFVNNGADPPTPDPAGAIARTTIVYDDEHGTVTRTDPRGKVSMVTRDGAGRPKHTTQAQGTAVQVDVGQHYADGGDTVMVNATSAPTVRTYSLNPLGAVTKMTVNGGTLPVYLATYDKFGRIETRRIQGMGLWKRQYDAFGRVRAEAQETDAPDNDPKFAATSYLLDGNDRVLVLTAC